MKTLSPISSPKRAVVVNWGVIACRGAIKKGGASGSTSEANGAEIGGSASRLIKIARPRR